LVIGGCDGKILFVTSLLEMEAGRTALRRLGVRIGSRAVAGDVIALVGELGAGKTFLAQHLVYGAGVDRSHRVASPTFTVVQEYLGKFPVFHADLYRLGDASELREIGLFEMGAAGLVIVEWANRFPEVVPHGALWIELAHVSPSIRHVCVRGSSESAHRLLGLPHEGSNA
jgi:tRNA threonylcarbamoyladenosine biosynthesis protein TsaE